MWLIAFSVIFILISLGLLIMIVTAFVSFFLTHVPFVPTAAVDIKSLARRGLVKPQDKVFDLGSGNGKVLFAFERFIGSTGRGFELLAWTHWYARAKKIVYGSKTEFVLGNFFNYDISEATIIYCYLYPPLMRHVGEKILADCKPGTKVIVRDFPIPNLHQTDHFATVGKHEMFIYEV